MPKVSVIIPVFGVEKYIERCARSLFEQTLDDIEFIFVDDCTNDDSISVLQKVLMEYPNRNNQTKIVYHDVNKGLPAARQTGLRIASGEYVAHCDSDDWVERSIYADMYEKASEEEADIVICDYNQTDGKTFRKTFCACHDTSITSYIENCLFGVDSWVVWNKLVKQFNGGRYGDFNPGPF